MLNNFCFNVYAQVTYVKCQVSNAYVDPWDMTCAVASAGHALSRRNGRACPVPSQVQGMPCPVANAGHALYRRKFRDTVDLTKLRGFANHPS